MDNDDNVYQGQNLHLVGEESSKVSPVLCPYSLPKFDFDEGHLRFDSLVENEVFLGIPSQEDNQWIEDFSRGSSGIEFSSSATNSCPIPRHNNVWSEATSSESVEMLLKSVGQEEMIPGESKAVDELPSLTEQMDDKIVKVEGFNSELPPVEHLGKLSESSQNPGLEDAHGKSTSLVQEDLSIYGSSGDISEKGSTDATEENLGIHVKSSDEHRREVCASVDESLSDKMQEHPSVSGVKVQDAECLLQNVPATGIKDHEIGDHSGQDNISIVNYKKSSNSSAETHAIDLRSPLQVASQVEAMEKCGAEVTATDLVGPSRSPVGNSELTLEEQNEEACSMELTKGNSSACVASSKNMEIRLQFESSGMLLDKSSVTNQIGDGNVNGCPVEVGHSDTHVICSEQKKKSDTQISHVKSDLVDEKDDHLGSIGQMGIGSSAIEMEAPKLSEMQSEPSKLVGRATGHGDDHSLLVKTSTSVGDYCGLTESRKDGDDAACLNNGDSNAAVHVAPPNQAGSADFDGEVSSLKQVDVHECGQSVLVLEKGGEEMPSDSDKIGHDSVGSSNDGNGITSSSLAEVAKENVEAAPRSEIDASVRIENASNFDVEATNPLSHDRVKSASLLNAAAAEVASHNEEQRSNQFEGKRGTHLEAPVDAAKSLLEESRDDPFQQCSDSVTQTVKPDDFAAEKAVLKDVNQSSNAVLAKTSDAAISVEQVVGERASPEISDKIELCSFQGDPNAKVGDGAEVVDAQNQEEPSGEKNHVAASSEVQGGDIAAEIEKSGSASDAVGGLSQSEMDKQAGVKDGMVENPPLSDGKERIGGKASSHPMSSGLNVASEEEKSFTFEVCPLAGLPQGGISEGWQSVPNIQALKRSKVGDGSASTSGSRHIDPKVVQEISRGSQQTPDKGAPSGGAKGASERKIRRGSAKSGKENARKGNSMKETVPLKQSERGDRSPVSIGLIGTGQVMQLEVGSVERGGSKPGMVLSVSGSSLPDLNTSAPVSLLFQQPFTDLQQVQLRAQIFVYGSLIQGVAPDEACMVSAFGISDGERSFWEPAWRACLERIHGQKTPLSSTETPGQSRSDQANKHGLSQSKVPSIPAGRVSSKSTPSPVVNPVIPLSSPLWNISAPSCNALPTTNMVRGTVLDYQALSPLHAYQASAVRNFDGHTMSWSPQAPFPGSWVSCAQSSAVDISGRFPAVPITETVKLTPIKESSVPIFSSSKIAPSNPVSYDLTKVTGSHAQRSADLKSRKRKKTSVSEDLGQIAVPVTQTGSVSAHVTKSDAIKNVHVVEDLSQGFLVSGNHAELVSAPTVGSHFSASVATTSPANFVFKSSSDKSLIVSPVSSIDHLKGGDVTLEKRLLKPEDVAKVEEAKLQAEEASAHAAIAVAHCQNVWCQLDKHSTSGLMSDVEAKLASAAVAIAASASIAKAAAAAAKIASNVALQAKLMADEALVSSGTQNPTQRELQSVPGFVNNIGNATPASILKVGDENNGSSSIIFAAREAARRKIEAASTASRHADNLDAIVKAAELAAEAVSQAGKVVAMGDPLSIGKLVEAGPDGYWKGSKLPSGHGAKPNNMTGNKSNINTIEEVANAVVDQTRRPSDKEMHTRNNTTSPFPKEISKNMVEDHKKGEEDTSASVIHGEKDFRGQKNWRASDLSKMTSVVPELEIGSRSSAYENLGGTLNDNGIKEGSLVEVFKDNGDFTGAWYSANVLSLNDGKALVCYTDLESDEGSGKLKEWIALEAEGSKPPRIRLAHPMTSITFDGTRKRRRAAVRDYAWSLHDRVDAWIENCWREGVIIEKNKKDETTLSIHFPAQGKTSVVRAWHLRPTLVWKDGEWIEWSNFRPSLQGDTPQEKRLKPGSPPVEGKGKAKVPKNINFAESGKSEESRMLPLSANEKVFNIGSNRNDKPEILRTMRSGLQKEGSKVVFGVPKPGKKRKFMEVSKHYVSDRGTKNNAPSDFLMPHGSGSRGWRNNSKIDSKETQSTEFNKPKGLKYGKPPKLPTKTLPRKDNAGVSSASASKDATSTDNLMKDSTSNDENDSGQQNLVDFVSFNTEAAEEPISLSSQAPTSDASRKTATLNAKSERLKKGKLAPVGGKTAKVEVEDKPIPEAVEPRRSNRRIQPTSRLLEGLQSSLVISKIPPVSHDKNQRSQNRGASKRE